MTGGAGYIGAPTTRELLAAGHEVTVLDVLLHGQEDVAAALEAAGARVLRGDVRDSDARRAALAGADAVVHLAAIVGDPACAADPERSHAVNVEGTRAPGRRRERRAPRLRFHVLELRAHVRSARAGRRDRAARARLALRGAEGRDRARAAEPAVRDLPALRDDLRRRRADALRPHRQRVHPRPLGRPHARRLRRAVLAPVRARRRRGARGGDGARGAARAGRRSRVQRRPQRRELPQARPRRADPRAPAGGRRALRAARRGPARLPRLVRAHPLRARLRAGHAGAGRRGRDPGRPRAAALRRPVRRPLLERLLSVSGV